MQSNPVAPPRRVNSYQVSQISPPAEGPSPNSSFLDTLWRWFMPRSPNPLLPSLRGAQLPTISTGPITQHTSRTEIAIATPSGLEIFANGPEQPSATPTRPSTPEDTSSDTSSDIDDSSSSNKPIESDGNYHTFQTDYTMLVGFLVESGFSRRPLTTPGRTLEEQVEHFLTASRPFAISGAPYCNLTRFVIYSGHNSNDHGRFSLKAKNCTGCSYSWARLPKAIKGVPPHILVVTIMACCFAGDAVNIVQDGLQADRGGWYAKRLPKLVMMSSSGQDERSFASTRNGDHALGALIDALQARDLYKSYDNWQSFEDFLMTKLKVNRDVHGPEWGRDHPQGPFFCVYNVDELTPFDVFRDLIKYPSAPATRSTISSVVQGGGISSAESYIHTRGSFETSLQ